MRGREGGGSGRWRKELKFRFGKGTKREFVENSR